MKVFIVYAHPEPRSFNGQLFQASVEILKSAGHEVQVSDLYAMKWKASADRDDFPWLGPDERLNYTDESQVAFQEKKQLPEIEAEQQKLLWADVVIFHFPMWWFSMPAILKGWVDRVFAKGFAYGVGQHGGKNWGARYGEGSLEGRKSMVTVTVGGRQPQYGPRGINGFMDDILWPIQHGTLFYPGMKVLPPFVAYQIWKGSSPTQFDQAKEEYKKRLLSLETTEPIPYRRQNDGDYDHQQVLKAGREGDLRGLAIHQIDPKANIK